MTDIQLVTLAIAIIVPLSLLLFSNSRIDDAKETLRADLQVLRAEMKNGFDTIQATVKVHEREHRR